jgi:hypothetical protein
MGVGVYSSDFNGSGGTFIVDGLVGGDEEYRKYVLGNVPSDAISLETWRKEVAEDPDSDEDDYKDYLYELAEEESDDLETWQGDQDSALIEDIEETIKAAARQLGMTAEETRHGRYARAGFDDNFVLMASGTNVDIGWRSWEHDIIVGVGGSSLTREWAGESDAFAGEIIDNTGLAPSTFADIYGALSDAVQTYVRLSLMRDGKECRHKTSGYTTSAYQNPEEGFDAALEMLRQKIATLGGSIPQSFHDGVILAGQSEREDIVQALVSGDVNSDTPIVLPLYDLEQGDVRLYSTGRRKFIGTLGLPPAFAEATGAAINEHAGSGDFLALPRTDELVEAWSAIQSAYPDHFIVSTEEWIGVVGGDPAIEWRDSDGQEWQADILFVAKGAGVSP